MFEPLRFDCISIESKYPGGTLRMLGTSLNLHIVHILEDTFSLGAAKFMTINTSTLNLFYNTCMSIQDTF